MEHTNAYFVLSGSHAIIDLFELSIMWAQEFEGLGYRGHGCSRGANLPAQFFQCRMVQSCVLFLQVDRGVSVCFILLHTEENIEKAKYLHLISPPSFPSPPVAVCPLQTENW